MVEGPSSKANSHSASQETPRLLWNHKAHYRVHKSPPLVATLSHMNLVHTFPPYFHKTHSNVISPSTHRSSEPSIPLRVSDQNFGYNSYVFHVCYMPPASHPLSTHHPNNIRRSAQVMKLFVMLQACDLSENLNVPYYLP